MLPLTPLDTLRETTVKLVEIPSVSSDRVRCHEVLSLIRTMIPKWDTFHTEVFEHEGYQSLIVSTRPGRAAPLILNGHVDVVTATPGQFTPEIRDDGLMWGRGVYDMKGSVAVYVELLRKLSGLRVEDRPHIQIQFVSDEEIGGHRGVEVMVKEGFDTDFFLAGEPTDLRICNRAKGVLWVELRLSGNPGHSARPWLCQNPLNAVVRGIHSLTGRFPVPAEPVWCTTATVTGIDVGENSHNRVPDQVTCKIDIRYIPEDDPHEIMNWLRKSFHNSDLELIQLAVPLSTEAENHKLLKAQETGRKVLGETPKLFAEHFASDARYYSAIGTPAVCWGPSGGGMHAHDERLDLKSLQDYSRVIDQLIYDLV